MQLFQLLRPGSYSPSGLEALTSVALYSKESCYHSVYIDTKVVSRARLGL